MARKKTVKKNSKKNSKKTVKTDNVLKEQILKALKIGKKYGYKTKRQSYNNGLSEREITRFRISLKTGKLYSKKYGTIQLKQYKPADITIQQCNTLFELYSNKVIRITVANNSELTPVSADNLLTMVNSEAKNRNQSLYIQDYNFEVRKTNKSNKTNIDDIEL